MILIYLFMSLLIQSMSIAQANTSKEKIVEQAGTIQIQIPKKPLANQSLQVRTISKKGFQEWTKTENQNGFESLQNIASIWKQSNIAEQYLIYGKQKGNKAFTWEIIPFSRANTIFERFWKQFIVLCKITFPGKPQSEKVLCKKQKDYQILFKSDAKQYIPLKTEILKSTDPFCQSSIIEKQLVIEGKKINVLYNYAPIGFGGERLHFLFIPKQHKARFNELTADEYLEVLSIAKKMSKVFFQNRSIQDIYFFHKTGTDAGQTVSHWHMHMILTTSKSQDFFGKLTVLKKMLFGASPMKEKELKSRIEKLRSELGPFFSVNHTFCYFYPKIKAAK